MVSSNNLDNGACENAAFTPSWRAIALQMHQQRKALHKEHEELFDSEVEKLVELNYINQLPAVARQRCVSALPIKLYSASASSTS